MVETQVWCPVHNEMTAHVIFPSDNEMNIPQRFICVPCAESESRVQLAYDSIVNEMMDDTAAQREKMQD